MEGGEGNSLKKKTKPPKPKKPKKRTPNNCIDSGHDYLIIMFMYCNHMMQLPAAHVVFVSSVKYGQVTASFGQASEKKSELGEDNLHIYKNIWQSFCFINRFNAVLFKILRIL